MATKKTKMATVSDVVAVAETLRDVQRDLLERLAEIKETFRDRLDNQSLSLSKLADRIGVLEGDERSRRLSEPVPIVSQTVSDLLPSRTAGGKSGCKSAWELGYDAALVDCRSALRAAGILDAEIRTGYRSLEHRTWLYLQPPLPSDNCSRYEPCRVIVLDDDEGDC